MIFIQNSKTTVNSDLTTNKYKSGTFSENLEVNYGHFGCGKVNLNQHSMYKQQKLKEEKCSINMKTLCLTKTIEKT